MKHLNIAKSSAGVWKGSGVSRAERAQRRPSLSAAWAATEVCAGPGSWSTTTTTASPCLPPTLLEPRPARAGRAGQKVPAGPEGRRRPPWSAGAACWARPRRAAARNPRGRPASSWRGWWPSSSPGCSPAPGRWWWTSPEAGAASSHRRQLGKGTGTTEPRSVFRLAAPVAARTALDGS